MAVYRPIIGDGEDLYETHLRDWRTVRVMMYKRAKIIGAMIYCWGRTRRRTDWMDAPRMSQVGIESESRMKACIIVVWCDSIQVILI